MNVKYNQFSTINTNWNGGSQPPLHVSQPFGTCEEEFMYVHVWMCANGRQDLWVRYKVGTRFFHPEHSELMNLIKI
jgi:hypothetical protein